ncbi:hypothetical protein GCM10009555_003820 [Acrocarpospora macrocephala]|uniref:Uncharacterized protein n=1 Tax=Acrocarpospora macrocephala TaxID=150177 RepID=A0A5M3X3A0_9ACTN|nr:hypothetical protein Amac_098250 [Acrocarpospora macrocephala]
MLVRLAYLAVTNTFSFLRLLHRSDRDKELEILVLRHQVTVLQRQVVKPAFTPEDPSWPHSGSRSPPPPCGDLSGRAAGSHPHLEQAPSAPCAARVIGPRKADKTRYQIKKPQLTACELGFFRVRRQGLEPRTR